MLCMLTSTSFLWSYNVSSLYTFHAIWLIEKKVLHFIQFVSDCTLIKSTKIKFIPVIMLEVGGHHFSLEKKILVLCKLRLKIYI